MMNLLFIFVAFGWFCLSNYFATKKYLPIIVLKFFDLLSKPKPRETHAEKGKPEEIEALGNASAKQVDNLDVDIGSKLAKFNFAAFISMVFLISISYFYILVSLIY